jgi:hypothetical protein
MARVLAAPMLRYSLPKRLNVSHGEVVGILDILSKQNLNMAASERFAADVDTSFPIHRILYHAHATSREYNQ